MRPIIQKIDVGDFTSRTPGGSVPLQPGPVTAKVCAALPVVRVPGLSKTLVHAESIGKSA